MAEAKPKPPLSHEGRWITDQRGRVVILHGFNMVYKIDSYRPEDAGFSRDDARFLSRHGFNTIRLGVIYKGLEPNPPAGDGVPRYRRPYLRSIARSQKLLARNRIFSLLDFHQDLYNERFQGEGWPDWQTIDDGLPAEPQQGFPANYLVMPALNRAFDHFWANDTVAGRGLQDAWAEAWRPVARRFRGSPYVMGYDIINEPWPGSAYPSCVNPAGCPAFDATTLTDFTNRVLASIRAVDPTTLVFYEPLLTFDFGAMTAHGDTGDRNAGFSFHNYCLPAGVGAGTLPASGDGCEAAEELVFDNADTHSDNTDDALLLTEYGATDDLETLERVTNLADEHMVGWQEWHYCACGEPTSQVSADVQALVKDPAKPPRGKNLKRAKLRVLDRPYPQVVAGTPESYSFDRETGTFQLRYSTTLPSGRRARRRLATEVYVPRIHYRGRYRVKVKGARRLSKPRARILVLKRRPRAATVTLKLTPRRRQQP